NSKMLTPTIHFSNTHRNTHTSVFPHNPTADTQHTCSTPHQKHHKNKQRPTPQVHTLCADHNTRRSLERRRSSRTFRYGYLVTTSSAAPVPPSPTPPATWLGHGLRVLPTLIAWRAVCTTPGNVFTATLLICDY